MPTPNIPAPDPEDDLTPYWVTDELQDAYHLALGRFMDAYSQTESVLSYYLTRFAAKQFGDDSERGFAMARAMLGSLTTDPLKDTIKKIMIAARIEKKFQVEVGDALDHLGHIQSLRNKIMHSGAAPEFHDGRWAVRTSNHNRVRIEANIVVDHFTIEDLDDMRTDLSSIEIRVRHGLFTTHSVFPDWRKLVESTKAFRDAQEPWKYKPVSQQTRSPKKPARRSNRKGQARQREA